jgi:hypothetical protein
MKINNKDKIIINHLIRDSGTCGHMAQIKDEKGNIVEEYFFCNHPYGEDFREWAGNLIFRYWGKECYDHIDWNNCNIVDDD